MILGLWALFQFDLTVRKTMGTKWKWLRRYFDTGVKGSGQMQMVGVEGSRAQCGCKFCYCDLGVCVYGQRPDSVEEVREPKWNVSVVSVRLVTVIQAQEVAL